MTTGSSGVGASGRTTPHRVGVIGTGGIARSHVIGYQHAGAQVVALCDVDDATLARRQAEWSVPNGYGDYRDLLADPAVEAVSICTPNSSHHPITLAAAAAGKHVLCEKPVSLDLAQAQSMIDACAFAGVVFQVGHHMRSWAAAVQAKTMIERGDIGTLLDNGCHLFDLGRYLGGDVRDIYARVATRKFDVEVEDTAIASLGFASGAMGQVEVSWTGTGWQEAFWVFGTEGSLECDNRVGSNVLTHRYRGSGGTTWADTDIARYDLQGVESHTQHVANFLEAIDGERPVVCTGADGLEAVRLVLASYESAAGGTVVTLPIPG